MLPKEAEKAPKSQLPNPIRNQTAEETAPIWEIWCSVNLRCLLESHSKSFKETKTKIHFQRVWANRWDNQAWDMELLKLKLSCSHTKKFKAKEKNWRSQIRKARIRERARDKDLNHVTINSSSSSKLLDLKKAWWIYQLLFSISPWAHLVPIQWFHRSTRTRRRIETWSQVGAIWTWRTRLKTIGNS